MKPVTIQTVRTICGSSGSLVPGAEPKFDVTLQVSGTGAESVENARDYVARAAIAYPQLIEKLQTIAQRGAPQVIGFDENGELQKNFKKGWDNAMSAVYSDAQVLLRAIGEVS